MSMVERVARALLALKVGDASGWDGPLLQERGREVFRSEARAIIKAMREPTEEMTRKYFEPHRAMAIYHWQTLIDAALAEPTAHPPASTAAGS